MASSRIGKDGTKYVVIEDVNNYQFMESSNAQSSALERFVATLVDKDINIASRPLKFDKNGNVDKSKPLKSTRPKEGEVEVLLTNDLMEKLPKETQEFLKRPVLSSKKLKLFTLKLLKSVNAAIIREAKKVISPEKIEEVKELEFDLTSNPKAKELCAKEEEQKKIDNYLCDMEKLVQVMEPESDDPDIDSEELDKAIKGARLKAVISVINYFKRNEGERQEPIKRYPENLTKIFEKATNILNKQRGLGFKSVDPYMHSIGCKNIPYSITIDYSKDGNEKRQDLLYNIRAGLTQERVTPSFDPAFQTKPKRKV